MSMTNFFRTLAVVAVLVASCSSVDGESGATSTTQPQQAPEPGDAPSTSTEELDASDDLPPVGDDEPPPLEEFRPFELPVGALDGRAPTVVGWLTDYEPAFTSDPSVGGGTAVVQVGETRIELDPDVERSGDCAIAQALEAGSGSGGASAKGCIVFADVGARSWVHMESAGELAEWTTESGWAEAFAPLASASVNVLGYDPESGFVLLDGDVVVPTGADPTECGDIRPQGTLDLTSAQIVEISCELR